MRRIKTIGADEEFYNKMEEFRKRFLNETGVDLSQQKITKIFAKNIKVPKISLINENQIKRKQMESIKRLKWK